MLFFTNVSYTPREIILETNKQKLFKLLRLLSMLAVTGLGFISIFASGGGGGSGVDTQDPGWQPGVFEDAINFINMCEDPRTGTDAAGHNVPDMQGNEEDEKNFLRSWSNDTYLWYDEIVDRDPGGSETVLQYFDLLVTNETTATGSPKDNFHFTYDTDEWINLSQSGVSSGYGANWIIISAQKPREVAVAFVEPGSPAYLAGLKRGDRIIEIDGVDIENGDDVITLNNGLFPSALGETHNFEVRPLTGNDFSVSLTSVQITSNPVPIVDIVSTATGEVGYLLFNDHIGTAEEGLYDAITLLRDSGITDLILDIRYNGGGYLAIASQLSYMIGGSNISDLSVFEDLIFNDKYPTTNPITGYPLEPTPFLDVTVGYVALDSGLSLPTLDLQRVFILTGSNTCSASESIINGLRGVGIDVIQIGSTTCGKPYGFYPQNNCGTTYFTVQFKSVNAEGFGEYPDGFAPDNASGDGFKIPGCSVEDDFNHQLGDPDEARFSAALNYRADGSCPDPGGVILGSITKKSDGVVNKPIGLQNRIMGR